MAMGDFQASICSFRLLFVWREDCIGFKDLNAGKISLNTGMELAENSELVIFIKICSFSFDNGYLFSLPNTFTKIQYINHST
mmetsp:Transcript_40527/g.61445  ORF Transcript_40527/g.61445 Transcript_40527/m.61445 type:complete len:82 (+) Transcript_40527:93-338(+)